VNVSFDAATNFCKWISQEGRLPTEKEWERAARGIHGFKYPWGGSALTKKRANVRFDDSVNPALMPVKQLPDGAAPQEKPGLEIYDLLGNAAEWCGDIYEAGTDDAADGPGVGKNHAIRGGSYFLPDDHECRATWRANVADKGALDVGFRMVVPVSGEAPAAPESNPDAPQNEPK
jgi:formylglycine-generating enzyme required for sulfatase activity